MTKLELVKRLHALTIEERIAKQVEAGCEALKTIDTHPKEEVSERFVLALQALIGPQEQEMIVEVRGASPPGNSDAKTTEQWAELEAIVRRLRSSPR